MLTFPDHTQVSVEGLDGIMAALYAQDKRPNHETATEMIRRLEEKKNFIPSSELVRREYAQVLLSEYRTYVKDRSGNDR
ncbi:MAG: hypothetical protein K9M96_03990 [Deltaproteobacteria bacterium]|nr:hypothetical protein [Deltaproteobacteria bacterium]